MSFLARSFLGLVAAVTFCTSGLSLQAQESPVSKPAVSVTVANLDKVKGDLKNFFRWIDFQDIGGFVTIMTDQYSKGLDPKRPAGVLVALDGMNPVVVAYLPLADIEKFNQSLSNLGAVEDLGDGLWSMEAGPQTLFAKAQGDWLFVGQSEEVLEGLPEDPTKYAGNAGNRYDLVVKAFVQNVPQEAKEAVVGQIRSAFEQGMEQQAANQTEEEQKMAREAGEQTMQQIERSIEQLEMVVLGWGVDSTAKKTFLDFGVQAVAGSEMAKDMAIQESLNTSFAGFLATDAAMTFRVSSAMAERDRKQAVKSLDSAKAQIMKQIDDNEDMDDKAREGAKFAVERFLPLLVKTLEEGKIDGGAIVRLDGDKLRFVVGGQIADGEKLAKDVQELVAMSEGAADLPEIKFNAYTHQDVTFHTATAPLKTDNEAASKVFGTEIPLVIGTGKKSFYLGLGEGSEDLLKEVLDKSKSSGAAKATPTEMTMQLGQILKYAQSIESNPILDMAIETIEEYQGKDKVQVTSKTMPGGVIYSLSIEEGVLKTVGKVSRNAGVQQEN